MISELGSFKVQALNLDIMGAGSPVNAQSQEKEKFHMRFDEINVAIQEVTGSLEGGDLSQILNMFTEFATSFVKTFLMRSFDVSMRESLADIVNQGIDKGKTSKTFPFKNQSLEFDFGLVDKGVHINDNYLSVIFDGTVH